MRFVLYVFYFTLTGKSLVYNKSPTHRSDGVGAMLYARYLALLLPGVFYQLQMGSVTNVDDVTSTVKMSSNYMRWKYASADLGVHTDVIHHKNPGRRSQLGSHRHDQGEKESSAFCHLQRLRWGCRVVQRVIKGHSSAICRYSQSSLQTHNQFDRVWSHLRCSNYHK